MSQLPYLRSGQGPTLVLVHGYLGGATQWEQEIKQFGASFDVIAPNLPGFGMASDLEGCNSIAAMAQSVLELLDHLGVKEFILLGHSMGGMIVQEMSMQSPERVNKLVLYGTGPLGLMPDRFEPIEVSRQRLTEDGVAKTIRRIGATWFKQGSDADGFSIVAQIGEQAKPQAAFAALEAMANWDGRAGLTQLTMPTLVIWGDADKSYRWPQVETLWKNIPDVHLSVIPGTAHAAHLEKPDLFHHLVQDFIGADQKKRCG